VQRGNERIGKKCEVIKCKVLCDREVGLEDKRLNKISLRETTSVLSQFINSLSVSILHCLVFRKNIIELSDTHSHSFSELFSKRNTILNFTLYVF